MVIGEIEGEIFAFRIEDAFNGYCVRPLDLGTGESDTEGALVFRSVTLAFAYADMIATAERFSFAGDDDTVLHEAFLRSRACFETLSAHFGDQGAPLAVLLGNEEAERPRGPTMH
jgi:hypothetical protein